MLAQENGEYVNYGIQDNHMNFKSAVTHMSWQNKKDIDSFLKC